MSVCKSVSFSVFLLLIILLCFWGEYVMQKKSFLLLPLLFFLGLNGIFFFTSCRASDKQKIRQPAVAGAFYPEQPEALKTMVDKFLKEAESPDIEGPVLGLIAPHAGYVYSGHVAASAYALLKGKKIKRVVVISPSHIQAFQGAAVYDGDAYATPLGNVLIDKDFTKKLAEKSSLIDLSAKGHENIFQGRGEHAVEVELPFLQRVLGSFKLVPIVMGDQDYETCRALGVALAELIDSPETIIVASSDLSHFHPYDEAVKLDHKVLRAIEEWDYFNLSRNLRSRIWEACGGSPIVATMIAVERLGANQAKLIKYANSGDVQQGDRSRVVGYSAMAFIKSGSQSLKSKKVFQLSKPDQEQLLKIAKNSVEMIVKKGEIYNFSSEGFETLQQERGAFVTLKEHGRLRGCIGYTAPIQPLCNTVRDAAVHAAIKDPRFTPVSEDELSNLSYEISVLSPFQRVLDIKEIEIGKHGLLMKKGGREGLLLPQVASEQGWDRLTFLQHTCRKAGLPLDAWKDKDTDIFLFSAFVFGEHD
jgi:AmmeMemoRadiSam system protein B/AmmeMemoRadiSam system protein A